MWRLRPLTLLPPSKPRSPLTGLVLTGGLSMIAADGRAARPALTRTVPGKASLRRSQRPRLMTQVVVDGLGKLLGSKRHFRTGFGEVEQGVNDGSGRVLAEGLSGEDVVDRFPLSVRQVGVVHGSGRFCEGRFSTRR